MKLELQLSYSIKGYSKLYGVNYQRIKAICKQINKNSSNNTVDEIRRTKGSHTCEYRLVKEPKGFIFRETLLDNGISGHHKTVKAAIATAMKFATIHIDEEFSHSDLPKFKEIEIQHSYRNNKACKHKELEPYFKCRKCGLIFHPDAD